MEKFKRENLAKVNEIGWFELSLDVHPAIADHPTKPGEKLYDKDGLPVPLITDQCCIRMAGKMIGYVMANNSISLIIPKQQLTEPVVEAIEAIVAELGDVPKVNAVAPFVEQPDDEDDE